MKKPKGLILSKKPWKVGQRVTTATGQQWGSIVRIVDKNEHSRLIKYKGARRWVCYVLFDGQKKEARVGAWYLFREGESSLFGGIMKELK